MKKFLLHTLLFFALLWVLAFTADCIITSKLRKERTSPFAVWNDIYDHKIESDVLVMGSSRAYVQFNPAVIDTILGVNSYNLGMDGRRADSQILQYKIYRQQHNKKPKLIIYEVSHGTMNRSNGYEREQFLPYLHDKNLWRATKSTEGFTLADRLLPCWRYLGYQKLLKQLFIEKKQLKDYSDPLHKGFHGFHKHWSGKALSNVHSVSYDKNPAIIQQYKDFVKDCKQSGIQVVMVISPFYIGGTRKMQDAGGMQRMFQKIAAECNVPLLDYTYDELSFDTAYFYNTMHLNDIGADIFSRKVANDIRTLSESGNL